MQGGLGHCPWEDLDAVPVRIRTLSLGGLGHCPDED